MGLFLSGVPHVLLATNHYPEYQEQRIKSHPIKNYTRPGLLAQAGGQATRANQTNG